MSKECFKCHRRLPLTEFYKHFAMGDGHLGKCKDCTTKDVRKNRAKNIKYYREYDQNRAMLPKRIKARKEYQLTPAGKRSAYKAKIKWGKENVLKRATHIMVSNAVRSGRMVRLPCEVCGATYRIHGHHEDYSKPFDVKWLCPKHHVEAHRKKR